MNQRERIKFSKSIRDSNFQVGSKFGIDTIKRDDKLHKLAVVMSEKDYANPIEIIDVISRIFGGEYSRYNNDKWDWKDFPALGIVINTNKLTGWCGLSNDWRYYIDYRDLKNIYEEKYSVWLSAADHETVNAFNGIQEFKKFKEELI